MAIYLSAREFSAAIKRDERDAKRRQKEIEKRLKEQAKLDALERAKLEVEEFESRIEVLLSIHKQRTASVDWRKICATLPLPDPPRLRVSEIAALGLGAKASDVERAKATDEEAYRSAKEEASKYHLQIGNLKEIGRGVLAGEKSAYKRALAELGIFQEIGELGSQLHFTVHNSRVVECILHVIGSTAIPAEMKSLASSGRVSSKAMPRARFHEIYQDYVCGCLLRVANELFALLPITTALVTAHSEVTDTSTGRTAKQPVLSVVFRRDRFEQLRLETLDPSDSVQGFEHRGNFKKSSKAETFRPIQPFKADEFDAQGAAGDMDAAPMLAYAVSRRLELEARAASLRKLKANL